MPQAWTAPSRPSGNSSQSDLAMPDTSHLLLFIAAGWLLNLTPGPDVLYIVSNSLRSGAKASPSKARLFRGVSSKFERTVRRGRRTKSATTGAVAFRSTRLILSLYSASSERSAEKENGPARKKVPFGAVSSGRLFAASSPARDERMASCARATPLKPSQKVAVNT